MLHDGLSEKEGELYQREQAIAALRNRVSELEGQLSVYLGKDHETIRSL